MPNDEVQLGALAIVLPSASESRCYVMHDLAALFSVETNGEALELFRARWRSGKHKGRLELDHESDHVFVYAGRDAVVEAAIVIHELAGRPLAALAIEEARKAIGRHKRPPRKKWRVGDLFAVSLGDGTFAFGQVLFEQAFAPGSGVRAPTCVLLEHRATSAESESIDVEEILTSRSLAILHELSGELDAGEWRVVGHAEPIADPSSGRCGVAGEVGSISGTALAPLARAWWGIDPWNVLYREDHWETYLLHGVERSRHARVLAAKERAAYRRDVFHVDDAKR